MVLGLALAATLAVAAGTAGDLDLAFDTDGIVVTEVEAYGLVRGVATQSDNRVVAVGNERTQLSDRDGRWVVHRYDTDGSLDTGFGSSGKVMLFGDHSLNIDDEASDVAVDSSGRIVVVGNHWIVTAGKKKTKKDNDIAVVRLNANGALDNTFGDGGVVHTDLGNRKRTNEWATDVVLQSDGKILVAGVRGSVGQHSGAAVALVRYDANGDLDTGFGNDGILVDDFLGSDTIIAYLAVDLQSDGKIVVGGYQIESGPPQTADRGAFLARYKASGSVDRSFGTRGKAYADFELIDLAIDSSDKIVVSGSNLDQDELYLSRYTADGSLDTTFGTNGLADSGITGAHRGFDIVLDGSGRITVALALLAASSPGSTTAAMRFDGDGTRDTGFGTDGLGEVVDLNGDDTREWATAVALDGSGRIVLGGFTETTGTAFDPDWLLARYHG
jgi:uncharacterized delta-60 repeat protein